MKFWFRNGRRGPTGNIKTRNLLLALDTIAGGYSTRKHRLSRLSYNKGLAIATITLFPQGTLFAVEAPPLPISTTPQVSNPRDNQAGWVQALGVHYATPAMRLCVRCGLSLSLTVVEVRRVSVCCGCNAVWHGQCRRVVVGPQAHHWNRVTQRMCSAEGEGKYYDLVLLFRLTLCTLCCFITPSNVRK